MKKTMIAACVIACAAVVNASTCMWSTPYVEYADQSDINLDGAKYWVLCLGTSSDVTGISIVDGGIVKGLNTDAGQGIVDSDGIISPSTVGGTLDPVYAADNGKYFALLVWDGLDSVNGGKFGISDAIAMAGVADAPATPGNPMDFSNDRDSFGPATFLNQNVQATPEPTSGILLLIGVAGLALKRRRA